MEITSAPSCGTPPARSPADLDALASCVQFQSEGIEPFVRDGFLHENGLVYRALGEGLVSARGVVACTGTLLCRVENVFEVTDAGVRLRSFRYDVATPNRHLSRHGQVFQLDNVHGAAHAHVFDPGTGAERVEPLETAAPRLRDVLERMRAFWWDSQRP